MSGPQGHTDPFGDTPPENFVKFFTRNWVLSGDDGAARVLPGGSPGPGGCSRERFGSFSGGLIRGVVRPVRTPGAAAQAVLTTVRATRWFPLVAMTWITWAAQCSRGRDHACEGAHERPSRARWILDGMSTTERPRILVVGGGYVGLYAARRILKKMRYGEATVTVVDPRSYMTYQPFLPEAAAGSISLGMSSSRCDASCPRRRSSPAGSPPSTRTARSPRSPPRG